MGTLVKERPIIYGFNISEHSVFMCDLQTINVFRPTRFCRVMTKYGSDKGRRWHNYTTVYSQLVCRRTASPLRIFELGLGTNNPSLVSTMGETGRPGASHRGWRELFPLASIFGADIDQSILFQDDRIRTFYCDQTDRASIRALWKNLELQEDFDLLIEDGLHTFDANMCFLEASIDKIRPGGLYIIEDIETKFIDQWKKILSDSYANRYPSYEFALVVLPNRANTQDNNMLIIHSPRKV